MIKRKIEAELRGTKKFLSLKFLGLRPKINDGWLLNVH